MNPLHFGTVQQIVIPPVKHTFYFFSCKYCSSAQWYSVTTCHKMQLKMSRHHEEPASMPLVFHSRAGQHNQIISTLFAINLDFFLVASGFHSLHS